MLFYYGSCSIHFWRMAILITHIRFLSVLQSLFHSQDWRLNCWKKEVFLVFPLLLPVTKGMVIFRLVGGRCVTYFLRQVKQPVY